MSSIKQLRRQESQNFKTMPKFDFSVVSYNITVDFSDGKSPDHTWSVRKQAVFDHIKQYNPKVMCLQELSTSQSMDFVKEFPEKTFLFLFQTPSEVPVGIVCTNEEISEHIGKFCETAIIGIGVDTLSFNVKSFGRKWLNENPDTIPHLFDRSETDKGFGNMNTYRAVQFVELEIVSSNETLFVFNSHYPLSGNNATRFKCAECERKIIDEVAGENFWISCGDRNLIPTKTDSEEFNSIKVYEKLVSNAFDIRDSNNHYGTDTTFVGFQYDMFKVLNIEDVNGNGDGVFDVIMSNRKSKASCHSPGYFNSNGVMKLEDYPENFFEINNGKQSYASDHCLVCAVFD
jgi:mRNA deadenylase 3'-5' endonuclease subunit Ccr4